MLVIILIVPFEKRKYKRDRKWKGKEKNRLTKRDGKVIKRRL